MAASTMMILGVDVAKVIIVDGGGAVVKMVSSGGNGAKNDDVWKWQR